MGLQWGDEGKGKVAAYFSRSARLAVRFNGGPNAGHTILYDGRVLRLHLIPAGGVVCGSAAICAGVLVDLRVLKEELEEVRRVRGEIEVYLSPRASVIRPSASIAEEFLEGLKGPRPIGTTRRGIGPTSVERSARLSVRVADLLEPDSLVARLRELRDFWRLGGPDPKQEARELLGAFEGLEVKVVETGPVISGALSGGGTVVFEGAQGTMLDLLFGTFPYVTSSLTTSASAAVGCGVPFRSLGRVVGVAKAYTTRVGSGPFPTEIQGELAERIRSAGGEYGATTGRPRRIGWLDLPQLKFAVELNGVDSVFLTRLDTLSGLERVRVCVSYEGAVSFPESLSGLERVRPQYVELEGWPPIDGAERSRLMREGYGALHPNARRYVEFVESELGVPVSHVGIGPGIEEVLER
ncbi:MAG: adenylosuccinate synthetase [Nitrososphaerota archaeon]